MREAAIKAAIVAIVVVVVGIPVWIAWTGLGVIGLLFALPLAAWIASRLLVGGGLGLLDWATRRPLAKWDGAYYAFDDAQVRVFEDDGRTWFAVPDVMRALAWRDLPGAFLAAHRSQLRTLDGVEVLDFGTLERLLGARREAQAGRFLLWARRDVMRQR